MMGKSCSGLVKALPSALVELQAEIDVVECHTEIRFVEAAYGVELRARDDKAGRRYGAHLLRQSRPLEIAAFAFLEVTVRMPGAPANADEDTCVLHGSIRVQQPGSHGAHVWTNCMRHEPLQPVGLADLHVVVEETEHFAPR